MRASSVLVSSFVGVAAVAACQPALGFASPVNYYSASSPLNAYEDGVVQAQMYGRFSVENATYLRNDTTYRDPRPGGDAVFTRTHYLWFFSYGGEDPASWKDGATDQGPKTTSKTWYSQYDHEVFDRRGEKGRMRTQVCEDHGIFADPCSVWPQFTTDL
jgi:hypothetical protein